MTSCTFSMPASRESSWLMMVATSSVGLVRLPLISEKCARRSDSVWRTSSSRLLIRPTVAMA
ncbi:MAG: hypothetical protein BWY83_00665 [bacterium ADurb.Bin478]|nr:MAG: hypothetical protein BWY83_00665 [bacterium ADurb.Bin478]